MDDGNVGESMSIGSQKAILKRKAKEIGIHCYKFYVDDGYSGTNFNRPSFQQMIADIEAEKAAINQYRAHMKMIQDQGVNDVLMRIIKDEEYHIMILQSLI